MKGCKNLSMNKQEAKYLNNRKEIESEIIKFLRKEFENEIFKHGSFYTIEFYSIERKDIIFNNMLNKLFKAQNDDIEKLLYSTIKEIYDKNYYKILKNVETEKKHDEEYEIYKELIKSKEQSKDTDVQNNNNNANTSINIILNILKIICAIILFPLFFCIMIVLSACKNNKRNFINTNKK